MNTLDAILTGAIAMASATISVFFFSYWKTTRDRFFLFFGTSFLLETVTRLLLGVTNAHGEGEPAYYLIRLVAYALILIAIVDKNRIRNKD